MFLSLRYFLFEGFRPFLFKFSFKFPIVFSGKFTFVIKPGSVSLRFSIYIFTFIFLSAERRFHCQQRDRKVFLADELILPLGHTNLITSSLDFLYQKKGGERASDIFILFFGGRV
jgi:hypothetical protein